MEILNNRKQTEIIGDESQDTIESLLQEREKLINQGKKVVLSIKRPVYEYNPKRPDNYALRKTSVPEIIEIYNNDSISDIYDILFASCEEEYDHKPIVYLQVKNFHDTIPAISSMQKKLGRNFRIGIIGNMPASSKGFDASQDLTIDTLAEACFNRPLNKCDPFRIDINNPDVTDLIFSTFKQYTYPELFPSIVDYTYTMRKKEDLEQLGNFIISLRELRNVENFEKEAKKYSDPAKDLFYLSVLMYFAKNGPEFYEYVVGKIKPEQLQSKQMQDDLKKIKERNQQFEKKYITPTRALKNALITTSAEKVNEALTQEMIQENTKEGEQRND